VSGEEEGPLDLHRWIRLIESALPTLVGVAIAVTLTLEAIPTGPGTPGSIVTETHSSKSECPKRCDHPQTTDTKVKVTTTPPQDTGSESPLEKAIDNSAGVTLIRLAIAFLGALLVSLSTRRIAEFRRKRRAHAGTAPNARQPKITRTQLVLTSLTAGRSRALREALDRVKETGAFSELGIEEDPSAALVGLRDAIVAGVQELTGGVEEELPADQAVESLAKRHLLDPEVLFAIRGLIELGDRAAAGAEIDPAAAEWIRSEGQRLLAALRLLLGEARS
jgi:hypothetical protein